MTAFQNKKGRDILLKMTETIQQNKIYLSDLDGLIGDGDHGVNMNKGFSQFKEQCGNEELTFTISLNKLGMILMNNIGGSMGPIYGTIFMAMSDAAENTEIITLKDFASMMENAYIELGEIIDAKPGDKTLVDTFYPALESLKKSNAEKQSFAAALEEMKKAAKAGRDSTKNMIAQYGRASRLGERSKGVHDTGSVSCYLLLVAMADGIKEILE